MYIQIRDDLCHHGNLLRSNALLFTEELIREHKPTVNQSKSNSTTTQSIQNEKFSIGDFVYIEPIDDKHEPNIFCIESFEKKFNEEYFVGYQFYRPNQTYHLSTKKFLRQEVILTQNLEHLPVKQIHRICHVLHYKDYYKYQPMIDNESQVKIDDLDKDVYVCESRYNTKTKMDKKIKWWNLPDSQRVKLVPRTIPLEPIREILANENENLIHDSDVTNVDVIEKSKETIPYDSVINEKLNENNQDKKQFFEQIVLSTNCFYKIGDYVYVNDENNKQSILHIEQIWKDHSSYRICGSIFIRFNDILKREQLINTTRASYERELFKCDELRKTVSIDDIQGKCSVLSVAHYTTCK